jgi:hypothetical protein
VSLRRAVSPARQAAQHSRSQILERVGAQRVQEPGEQLGVDVLGQISSAMRQAGGHAGQAGDRHADRADDPRRSPLAGVMRKLPPHRVGSLDRDASQQQVA